MKLHPTSRVLAGVAVTAGLALAGLPAGAATAAPVQRASSLTATASYTCSNPLLSTLGLGALGQFTLPASFSLQNLPDVLTANVPIPAGTIPIVGSLDFGSAGVAGLLSQVQVTTATLFQGTPLAPVGVQLSSGLAPLVGGVSTLTGTLGTVTPGTSGLPVPIPTSFDVGLLTPVLGLLGTRCTLVPGSVVPTTPPGGGGGGGGTGGGGGVVVIGPGGVLTVVKQQATVKAKGAKVVKQGKKAVVTVKVKTSAGQPGVGDVVAKGAGTKVTKSLAGGKLRFVFKGLKLGKRTITFSFAGNAYTDAAKKKFTVRVVR